jgi:hypothetical protein
VSVTPGLELELLAGGDDDDELEVGAAGPLDTISEMVDPICAEPVGL